jgi:hypothetical protein
VVAGCDHVREPHGLPAVLRRRSHDHMPQNRQLEEDPGARCCAPLHHQLSATNRVLRYSPMMPTCRLTRRTSSAVWYGLRQRQSHVGAALADGHVRVQICDVKDRLTFEGIKKHPFFRSVDWDNIHKSQAPIPVQLKSDTDTSHFDKFEATDLAAVSARPALFASAPLTFCLQLRFCSPLRAPATRFVATACRLAARCEALTRTARDAGWRRLRWLHLRAAKGPRQGGRRLLRSHGGGGGGRGR